MIETPITPLLDQLKTDPHDHDTLFALMDIYLDTATDDQRETIRRTISTDRTLVYALEAWYMNATTTHDAKTHLRRGLAWLSMTEAYPSQDDAFVALRELIDFAHRYDLDPAPLLRHIRAISGERVRSMLSEGRGGITLTFRQFALMNALLVIAVMPVLVIADALTGSARMIVLAIMFVVLVGGQLVLLSRYTRS